MLYVIDNGHAFSEHGFYFVKTDAPRELVEAAIEAKCQGVDYRSMFIASTSQEVPSGTPVVKLEEFCGLKDLVTQWQREEKRWKKVEPYVVKAADALPLEYLDRVLATAPAGDPKRALLEEYIGRRRATR